MFVIWFIIGGYDLAVAQFWPNCGFPTIAGLTRDWFPIFGWRIWVFIGFVLILLSVIESSYRNKKAFDSQIYKMELELGKIKNERPKIEAMVRNQIHDFDIEVLNKGTEAEFEAQIEVTEGKGFVLGLPQNYSVYWDKTKNNKIELKKGQRDWLKIASLYIGTTQMSVMNFRLHYYEITHFENSVFPRVVYANSTSWLPGNTQVVRPCISLRITISSKPSMVYGAFIRTYELSHKGLSEVNS